MLDTSLLSLSPPYLYFSSWSPHTHTHTHPESHINCQQSHYWIRANKTQGQCDVDKMCETKRKLGRNRIKKDRKQSLLSKVTHVWMVCLMTSLQPIGESNRPCYHWSNHMFDHFQLLQLWPLCLLFFWGLQLTGGFTSFHSALSPSRMFPVKSPVFVRRVAPRPLSRADSVTTFPAGSKRRQKKDRNSSSWSDRPRRSDRTAAHNNRLLYPLTLQYTAFICVLACLLQHKHVTALI